MVAWCATLTLSATLRKPPFVDRLFFCLVLREWRNTSVVVALACLIIAYCELIYASRKKMKFSACGVEDRPLPKLDNGDDYVFVKVQRDSKCVADTQSYVLPWNTTWHRFKEIIHPAERFIYVDEEGDEIPVTSDTELREALKVAKANGIERPLMLHVPDCDIGKSLECASGDKGVEEKINYEDNAKDADIQPLSSEMPDDASNIEQSAHTSNVYSILSEEERCSVGPSPVDLAVVDKDCPPLWFTTYMENFKKEVISKVTRKVVHRFQNLLNKESKYNENHENWTATADSDGESTTEPKNTIEETPFLRESPKDGSVDEQDGAHPWLGVYCSLCLKYIYGIRYKCWNCDDFNICDICEATRMDLHEADHVFLKLRSPAAAVELERKMQSLRRPTSTRDGLSILRRHERRLQWDKGLERRLQSSLRQAASEELGVSKIKQYSMNLRRPVRAVMNAEFLYDETIPDGTKFFPGVKFSKRWRVRNAGSQPWTSDTKLKFLWGTKGFTPETMIVDVPHLSPDETGYASVDYVAPLRTGFYESHWSFLHEGHQFGHRFWCSIEVVDPKGANDVSGADAEEASEELRADVTQATDTSTFCKEVQEPEYGESCQLLQTPSCTSEEAAETQTGLEESAAQDDPILSTPTSSSPLSKSFEESLTGKSGAGENSKEKDQMHDSDLGSVISLSSSEDEQEFVVVPLPPCFNIPVFPMLEKSFTAPTPKSHVSDLPSNSSSCSSVVFIRSGNDESTPSSPSCGGSSSSATEECRTLNEDHTYALPPTSTEEQGVSVSMKDSKIDATAGSATPDVLGHSKAQDEEVKDNTPPDMETVEDHVDIGPMSSSTSSSDSLLSAEDRMNEPTLQPPVCNEKVTVQSSEPRMSFVSCAVTNQPDGGSHNRTSVGEPRQFRDDDEDERVVHVLPEGLVTAAASIFNSARTALSALQWVPVPSGDGHQTSSRYAVPPVTRGGTWPHARYAAPSELSSFLWEMGFCNSVMNATAIAKHHGNLEKVIDDLLQQNDNDWYIHRH